MISNTEFTAYAGQSPIGYPLDAARSAAHILEVGPGCGTGTLELLSRFPEAHIMCLEPDDAARNALLWNLQDHPEKSRVSVLPLTAQEAVGRRGQFDLIVAHHVICQVRVHERDSFWKAIRRLVTATGIVLCDSHFGRSKADSDVRRLGASEGRNGEFAIHRWFSCDAHGLVATVTNEYEFLDDQRTVVYRSVQRTVVDVVDVAIERGRLAAHGLLIEDLDDLWMRVTPAPPQREPDPAAIGAPGLRPVSASDAADVLAAFESDSDMARQGAVETLADAEVYVGRLIDPNGPTEAFAITDANRLVGLVAVTVDETNRSGWFWYWMNRTHRGRGWTARAAATVADLALCDGASTAWNSGTA